MSQVVFHRHKVAFRELFTDKKLYFTDIKLHLKNLDPSQTPSARGLQRIEKSRYILIHTLLYIAYG